MIQSQNKHSAALGTPDDTLAVRAPDHPAGSSKFKDFAVRWAVQGARHYLQNPWFTFGKQLCWERFCVPYLCWRETDFCCSTRFGASMIARPRDFVENRILFFGQWEPEITALFELIVRPGDVVIDVGSNVGYYSLLASRLTGNTGRVYAVEPSASIRARLTKNLQLNAADNVTVLPFAAWDRGGKANFHVSASDNSGASSLRSLNDRETRLVEEVELVRLADVIPPEDAARASFVKVDVEGAEFHALRGLEEVLKANKRIAIVTEFSPELLSELGGSAESLFDWMNDLGFKAYPIVNDYAAVAYIVPPPRKRINVATTCPVAPCYLLFTREPLV